MKQVMVDFERDRLALRAVLAERLKFARSMAKDPSPEDVEDMTDGNVSASYLRRIEGGLNTPSLEVIWALSQAYGSTLAAFFSGIDDALNARRQKTA